MARDGQPKERVKGQEVTNDLPPVWEHEKKDNPTPDAPENKLEGFYRGAKEIKYGDGTFLTHLIEDETTGEIVSFSGAIADRKMTRIPRDTYVWITYMGKIRSKQGKTKLYEVIPEEGTQLLEEKLI